MTESVCNCGKPTRDDAYVCDGCLDDFNRALAEIPWLVTELEVTVTKQKGIDYSALGGSRSVETPGAGERRGEARGAAEQPLPVNAAALEARRALRHALVMAVRFCDEEHVRHQSPRSGLPVDRLEDMSRWLMWRVDGLAFSDMGFEFVDDVTRAASKCRHLVDRRPERRYAGPCECGRDLYHKPGAVDVACRDCERVYTVGELYEWMRSQVRGRLVTAREGSTLLCKFGFETKQATIDKWAERGRVIERGHDVKRARLYLFDDLLDLAGKVASA